VVASLRALDLEDSLGADERRAVVVFAESGSADTKIAQAIADQRWHFMMALRKTRSVKSEALSLTTPHLSRGATLPCFAVVIAGARGTPCVWRRVATHASDWLFASDTPRALCAMWARSSWCVLHCGTDRMVAARLSPAMS